MSASAAVRDRLRLLALLRHGGPAVVPLIAFNLVVSAVPLLNALTAGWLVHQLSASAEPTRFAAAWPLAALATLLVVDEVARVLHDTWESAAAAAIDGKIRAIVRSLALAPRSVAHLEDAQFRDDVGRASDLGTTWRTRSAGRAATGQLRLVFRIVSALAATTLLSLFSLPLAALVLSASLTMRSIVRRQYTGLAALGDERARELRRAGYWADVAAGRGAAKEVRLFGLGDWVVGRHRAEFVRWAQDIWSVRRAVVRQQGWSAGLAFGTTLAAMLTLGLSAAADQITVAQLTRLLVATWAVFEISVMGYEAFDIEYGLGAVRAFDRLASSRASPGVDAGPDTAHQRVGRGGPIRFEAVTFTYPGLRHPVIDELSLEIAPGEVLAVVGHNGAGKTTLIKLLSGLYAPTGGRVTVGGVDLASADVRAWRQTVTVLFQDFIRYPMSAYDNVALGAPEWRRDRAGVEEAVATAGAVDIVNALPAGYDTVLSAEFTGGVDLSGGQWQRLAIARALFAVRHGRTMVILDEPTAHLDVTTEARFYQSVVSAVPGTTVVLISHRLSTVRHADRIVLLRGGRVHESGTHDELVAAGGEYARLFALQAERFAASAGPR